MLSLISAAGFIAAILIKGSIADAAKNTVGNVIIWLVLAAGVAALLKANYVLDKRHTATSRAPWSARWAGVLATMDISAAAAIILIGFTKSEVIEPTTIRIHDNLSGVSYIILAVVFLIIIGGLGWCFYRALAVTGVVSEAQSPDEV